MNNPQPLNPNQRILALDVLRGFALFGVLLANLAEYINYGYTATGEQLAGLASAGADATTGYWVKLLISAKARTIFYTLFGVGVYLQLSRLAAKHGDFQRLYFRRMLGLLAFGLLNLALLFPHDVLHIYALAGMALFFIRKLSSRWLLLCFVLLYAALPFVRLLASALLPLDLGAEDRFIEDAAVLARQQALQSWSYLTFLQQAIWANVWHTAWYNGFIFSGMTFMLSLFVLGTWIARQGWLTRPANFLSGFRVGLIVLPLIALAEEWLNSGLPAPLSGYIGRIGTMAQAGFYICVIVVSLEYRIGQRLLGVLAPVGRMALTNYIAGGVFTAWLFFGPWLLAPKLGLSTAIWAGLAFFALQILFSHWWLRRHEFGPLEWLWRRWTYR